MKHPIISLKFIAECEKVAVLRQERFPMEKNWETVVTLINIIAPLNGVTLDLSSKQ